MKKIRWVLLILIFTTCISCSREDGSYSGASSDNDGQEVVFEDEKFEEEIKKILKKKTIYTSDIEKITSLSIHDNPDLCNIEDLEKFPNLQKLTVSGCKVSDISVVGKLEYLKELDFSDNNIRVLDGIETADSLIYLDISENKIQELGPVYRLENLQILIASDNRISSVGEGINQLSGLEKLYLNTNSIQSVPELSDLKKLEELYLNENSIKKIESLGHLNNLKILNLSQNKLRTISFVKDCPNLLQLMVSDNKIGNINGAENCRKLQYLDVRKTDITFIQDLEEFTDLHTIYVDQEFDRSSLDFLVGNFRNADVKTKQYLLRIQYNLD